MRIVGGEWGGRQLVSPKGDATRPTSDAAREAMFNILAHGLGHEAIRVLDLFAGTGALALEALSRGAERALLVESDLHALMVIEKNTESLKVGAGRISVMTKAEIERWPAILLKDFATFLPFDTVFCDPPYTKGLVTKSLVSLERRADAFFTPTAVLVVETGVDEAMPRVPDAWSLKKEREKGAARLLFYQRS